MSKASVCNSYVKVYKLHQLYTSAVVDQFGNYQLVYLSTTCGSTLQQCLPNPITQACSRLAVQSVNVPVPLSHTSHFHHCPWFKANHVSLHAPISMNHTKCQLPKCLGLPIHSYIVITFQYISKYCSQLG